jgi:hypothetical protein
LLWVGTIYSIAAVSACDYITFTNDRGTVAKHGMFCFARPEAGSERLSYDEEDLFTIGENAGRVFGVLAAVFLPVALLLFHVVFFVKLPNLTVAKNIWWTVRVLTIFSVAFVLGSMSFFHGCVNGPINTDCRMGAGAALSGINFALMTVLTVLLFWIGPPKLPFRCACSCCKEREEGTVAVGATHGEGDGGEATPVVVQQKLQTGTRTTARTTTTTTEEEMEDGRLCITTETVDAKGNKKTVRKIVRKIVAAKPSHPSAATSATWLDV